MGILDSRLVGVTSGILSALCWGISTVMSKGALEEFPPVVLLNIQLASSLAFVWIVIAAFKLQLPKQKNIYWVASLGVLEPGIAYFLGLSGLVYVQATSASLIQSTEAIMIAVLATLFFGEKLRLPFWGLSGVALLGLTVVIGYSEFDASRSGLLGQVLIFGGTFSAAVYVILSSRISVRMNPFVMLGYQQLIAFLLTIFVLAVSYYTTEQKRLPNTLFPWGLAVVSGIFQYALAFALYFYSMRFLKAASVGAFLNLVPLFGIGGAWIFLGERVSVLQGLGALVTIGAVAIMSIFYMPDENSTDGMITERE